MPPLAPCRAQYRLATDGGAASEYIDIAAQRLARAVHLSEAHSIEGRLSALAHAGLAEVHRVRGEVAAASRRYETANALLIGEFDPESAEANAAATTISRYLPAADDEPMVEAADESASYPAPRRRRLY